MGLESELSQWLRGHKFHRIRNTHGSTDNAYKAWTKGQLWAGQPLRFGTHKIHVYGLYMRNWSKVYVEFTERYILVVKPPH